MRIEKPKINVGGWFWIVVFIGIMWFILMNNAIEEYFIPNGVELAKFIFALLATVIIWFAYITIQARSWENYGDEIRRWQADHDVRFAEQLFKVSFGKAIDIYNIGRQADDGDDGSEVIGG